MAGFSAEVDALGDAYEYLIGQFAAGSGKKAGDYGLSPDGVRKSSEETQRQ